MSKIGNLLGGGDDSGDALKQQMAEEEAREAKRQKDIADSVAMIDAMFKGGTLPAPPLTPGTAYNPNAVYYNPDGTRWYPSQPSTTPPAGGGTTTPPAPAPVVRTGGGGRTAAGGGGGGGTGLRAPRSLGGNATGADTLGGGGGGGGGGGTTPLTPEQQFQALLASGGLRGGPGQSFAGFTPEYFSRYRQGILDWYGSDLERQFADMKRNLLFNLSRAGLLRGTEAARAQGRLQEDYDVGTAEVANRGETGINSLKNQIEAERQALIASAQANADPELTANLASASAANLANAQPDFQPLGAIFAGAAGTYDAYRFGQDRRNALDMYGSALTPPSIGGTGGSGSGRVVV